MPVGLDALNRAGKDDFIAALGGIFEHSPWIAAAIVEHRPFTSLAALHEAMKSAVRATSDEQKLALLRIHPDLAGKAAQAGTITADSKSEQGSAGLDRLSAPEFERFNTLNAAYNRKFNFPFILCVRRHTKDSIFRQFEDRITNDLPTEYEAALNEIFRITALRLDQHVSAADRLHVNGFMDVHVIDIQRGVPAEGLRVGLHEVSASGVQCLASSALNARGVASQPFFEGRPIPIGQYELQFAVGDYFGESAGKPAFLDTVPVRFSVAEAEGRYHIPLRITPSMYTVYRGW
jgi:2-oxo-4-hydroxy-4-carboxy-5-ureidoimidazoline decarboxylase